MVIGGGAAGFFCAVNAARLNPVLEVMLIEQSTRCLRKVRISGGGRCNVTHACFDIVEMSNQYPRGNHFLRKSFHHFFTQDSIRWFEERGVPLKTETDGRVFPVSDSSSSVIDCLMKEADRYQIEVRMNCAAIKIQRDREKFRILVSEANELLADFICVACGGFPRSQMFDWLIELGHSIEDPLPSLFTFNMPGHSVRSLMGISVEDAEVSIQGTKLKERGNLLITHWGMSGPAILRLSAWGARKLATGKNARPYHFVLRVNWLPSRSEASLRAELVSYRQDKGSAYLSNRCPFGLPQRLWAWILQQSGVPEEWRWADLTAAARNALVRNLSGQHFEVSGKTTFKEEFVTSGGIRLSEIDPHTLQSKIIPNLFFAGEVIDADGITGGFNFQQAWTSGFLAAQTIAKLTAT